MPNIDDLSVGIKSNVTSATNSIDKLIKRLGVLSTSLGQVNTSGFYQMANGINQIESATRTLTSDSANKLTSLSLSIRKFGSATATAATSNIPQLASSITLLSNTMNTIGAYDFNANGVYEFARAISKLGGVKVGEAITNLPYLGTVIQQLSKDIAGLEANSGSISNLTQLATALSRLGGKSVTTSISNIPQLTRALMQMFDTLSKAPQVSQSVIRLTEAMANLASQGSKVGVASRSMQGGLNSFSSSARSAHKSATSLASAIGKLYAKYWLLFRLFSKFGKAIEFASDLKEVQNVIDVSFGDYKGVIEEFSKTSIQDYGISELTAKRMAGRFQAMGTAVGFSQEKMAEMSTTLTGLAADMGSFYNVEAEDVAESLQSVFTGTTKPLRQYGIDLTNATLQEWLLTKGIDANVKTMTQAEKVMLRYNYVLEHTRNAQGDFQRTQDTWANQIRMLKQNFQALGGVIGQNFVYALKPVVSALNTVMLKLIQFAKVVSESLGTIFGWKYEDTTGGIVNDLEVGSDLADDLGAGLGGAADNAKKLHQQLQGFDELNVLTTQKDTGKGGGGGGGGLGDYDFGGSGGQWTKIDDADKFFTSDLDTLYKLGDHISTTMREQLQKIDWEEVYQGAKDWGSGLASFLNGYINPDTFRETGKVVAGALNSAVYFALSFAETFDFANFGNSWAQRFNGFFEELDTSSLAKAISKWIRGALTSVTTFLNNTDFELIGQKVGDFITNIDWAGIVIDLGKLAGAVLSAIVRAFVGLSSDPVAMLEIGGAIAIWFGTKAVIGKISAGIAGAVTSATAEASLVNGITAAGGSLGAYLAAGLFAGFAGYGLGGLIDKYVFHNLGIALDDLFTGDDPIESQKVTNKIEEYAADLTKSYQDLVNSGYYTESTLAAENAEAQFNATRNKLLTIKKIMQKDAKYLSWDEYIKTSDAQGALEQLYGGDEKQLQKQYESLRIYMDNVANLPTTAALAYSKAGVSYQKTTGTIQKNTKMCTSALQEYEKHTLDFDETTGEVFKSFENNVGTASNSFVNNAMNMQHSSLQVQGAVISNMNSMNTNATNAVNSMKNSISSAFNSANTSATSQSQMLTNNVIANYSGLNKPVSSSMNLLNATSNSGFASLNTGAMNGLKAVVGTVGTQTNAMNTTSATGMKAVTNTINSAFGNLSVGAAVGFVKTNNTVKSGMDNVSNTITGANLGGTGMYLVQGLEFGIKTRWTFGLIPMLIDLAKNLTTRLQSAFKIGSPSKLWRDEIGYWLPAGLEVGIEKGETSLLNTVDTLSQDINSRMLALNNEMNGSLTLATPDISSAYSVGVSSTFEHEYNSSSMSSNIADGISRGMYSTQNEQNSLLREQNELLYQILQKEAVSTDDLYNVVVQKNRDTFNRTGDNLLLI